MRNLLLIILLNSLALVTKAQSGWTRQSGGIFAKLDLSLLASDAYYNLNGSKVQTSQFQQTSLNLYAEYGLNNRFTLIAQMPLLRRNAFETTEAVYGAGDLRLDLKFRVTQNPDWPVSIAIGPEFPTGRRNAFAQSTSNSLERINLPTGDGEFNVWTTLAGSRSFGKFYTSMFGAYNFRTKYEGLPFRNLYQFGVEGGWNPWRTLWINAKLRAQFSEGESRHVELGFVRGDATTYTLASIEGYYKFSRHWGAAITLLSGGDFIAPFRNIYIAPYFSFGVVYEK